MSTLLYWTEISSQTMIGSLNALIEVEELVEMCASLGTGAHRHRSILPPGVKYIPGPWGRRRIPSYRSLKTEIHFTEHAVLINEFFSTAVKSFSLQQSKKLFSLKFLSAEKPLFKRKTSCFLDTFWSQFGLFRATRPDMQPCCTYIAFSSIC